MQATVMPKAMKPIGAALEEPRWFAPAGMAASRGTKSPFMSSTTTAMLPQGSGVETMARESLGFRLASDTGADMVAVRDGYERLLKSQLDDRRELDQGIGMSSRQGSRNGAIKLN